MGVVVFFIYPCALRITVLRLGGDGAVYGHRDECLSGEEMEGGLSSFGVVQVLGAVQNGASLVCLSSAWEFFK